MGAQSSQVVLLEERANRLGEFLSLSLEDRHALPRSHLALRNIRHRVYAHFEVATDWRRKTGAVSEGNSRNHLLTRVASKNSSQRRPLAATWRLYERRTSSRAFQAR